MNLAWIGVLTLAVLVEKVFPGGERISALLGAALIIAGSLPLLDGLPI